MNGGAIEERIWRIKKKRTSSRKNDIGTLRRTRRARANMKRRTLIENNPNYYADRNKRARERYRSDPEFRAKIKASNYLTKKRRRAIDPAYRAKRAAAVHMRAKRRRAIDPQFKIRVQLLARLHAILRRACVRKSARTQTLIGCQYSVLMRWLEASFQPGTYTWENHGPIWHIDHKRPCASYDLTNRDEQLKCFHYTNLQPLFASENILKSSWHNGKLHRHEKAAA